MIDHETLFPTERDGSAVEITLPIDKGTAQIALDMGFEMIPVKCNYCGDAWCHFPNGGLEDPECNLCGIGHGVVIEL